MATNREKALALVASRDLRFYNMVRWSNMDALEEAAAIEAAQGPEMIPVLAEIYRTAIDNMTEAECGNLLHGFKTCPPIPGGTRARARGERQ